MEFFLFNFPILQISKVSLLSSPRPLWRRYNQETFSWETPSISCCLHTTSMQSIDRPSCRRLLQTQHACLALSKMMANTADQMTVWVLCGSTQSCSENVDLVKGWKSSHVNTSVKHTPNSLTVWHSWYLTNLEFNLMSIHCMLTYCIR